MLPRDARGRDQGHGQGLGMRREGRDVFEDEVGGDVPVQFSMGSVHPRTPEGPPAAVLDAGALLQQLAAAMATMAGGARVEPQPSGRVGVHTLGEFRKMRPPTFDGSADVDLAESFLSECETILEALEVGESSTRITLTVFQLMGRASDWWYSLRDSGGSEGLTWEQFKEKFRDHFLPQSLRDTMREEFVDLIQGTMSVLEYERRFTVLSKYAPEMIATPHLKCRRFEKGLRPRLRNLLVLLGLENYETLVNRAMAVERDLNETKGIVERRRSKNAGGQSERESSKKLRGDASASEGSVAKQSRGLKGTSGKQMVCYICKQQGHKNVDCPRNKKRSKSKGRSGSRQSSEARICFACGQEGHVQRFCPHV